MPTLDIPTNALHIIGIVFSAIGVTLSVINCFFLKIHSRALDYIQWGYFLAVVMSNYSVAIPFSTNLEVGSSLIALSDSAMANFYCSMSGTFVCARPFALSFMVILVGFLILMALITIPAKVKEAGITFTRVYRLFKGLFKWFYLPLMLQALYQLIITTTNIVPPIVILAVLCIFPIAQLVLYRIFDSETENPITKWLQFANYVKAGLFALLAVLVLKFNITTYFYFMVLLIIANAAFVLLQYEFQNPTLSRVLYASGQVIFYFLFSLYVSGALWVQQYYYLDLFIIGLILIFDIIFSIVEGKIEYKKWNQGRGAQVIPENSKDGINKKNRYQYEPGEELVEEPHIKNESRDQLKQSRADSGLKNSSQINKSPKKNRV